MSQHCLQQMWLSLLTHISWWRHQMETFSALLALCAGNSPVTGEFPSQRSVTWRFDVFFDLHLDKRLSKQSRGRWFETPWRSLWRPCNDIYIYTYIYTYTPLALDELRLWGLSKNTTFSNKFVYGDIRVQRLFNSSDLLLDHESLHSK